MRVFVTGSTGYIGTAVVRELINAGHTVVGMTRSEQGAAKLQAAGAEPYAGTVDDLDSLRNGAASADGIIHLAFDLGGSFAGMDVAHAKNLRAIQAMGEALVGSGKPLVVTRHVNGEAAENAAMELVDRGVRPATVSLAPSVHDDDDMHGFVPQLIATARAKGVSAYVGDGANRWPAVHRLDAASLFRLAVESAPAGSWLNGVGDEGIPFREIASVIGRHLNVPVASIAPEEAATHFGWLGAVVAADLPRSSADTQQLLGWRPTHPGLIADLEQGHYFAR